MRQYSFLAVASVVVAVSAFSVRADAWSDRRRDAVARVRPLVYNTDGCDMLYWPTNLPPTVANFTDRRLKDALGTHIATVSYCPQSAGFGHFTCRRAGEPLTGDVPHPDGDRRNAAKDFFALGTDSLEMASAFCRTNGLEVFVSIRVNDQHDAASKPGKLSALYPPFKQEHPECLMGSLDGSRNRELYPKYAGWSCVDFGHELVRERMKSFVRELVTNYDVDGVEYDFNRHFMLFRSVATGGEATADEVAKMTQLMRELKAITEEVGRRKNRPIVIAMRMPDSVGYDLACGADVETWFKERLVDIWIAGGYFLLNQLPVSIDLAHRYGIRFFWSLDESRIPAFAHRNKLPVLDGRMSLPFYAGRFSAAQAAGCDGVYVFNIENEFLRQVSAIDPRDTRNEDKVYFAVDRGSGGYEPGHWLKDGERFSNLPKLDPGYPHAMKPGECYAFEMFLGDDFRGAKPPRVTVQALTSLHDASLALSVNGRETAARRTRDGLFEVRPPVAWLHAGINVFKVTFPTNAPAGATFNDFAVRVEPDRSVNAAVGYDDGNLPKIFIDGKPHFPLIDNCGHPTGSYSDPREVDAYLRHSIKRLGPRILNIGISDWIYRRPDGSHDWSALDRRVKTLLSIDPDAHFLIGIRFVYQEWARQHPDEHVVYGGRPLDPKSGDEYAGAPMRPSSASLAFRREVSRDLESFAAHIRQAPWGNRVIAVRPCYGVATEWFSYGPLAYPDMSAPMLRFFRDFLRREYGSDAALRKAWNDDTATIAGATIPPKSERTSGTMFIDVVHNRRTVDFNRAMAEAMADLLVSVGREIKRLLPGRIVGVYYGYVLNAWPGNSANFLLDRVLSSGAIDFFSDPADYDRNVRKAGGDFGHKTIVSTLRRYGKIGVIEDDSRLSFFNPWAPKGWAMADVREDRAVLRRNVLNTLFDRDGYQICDPGAPSGKRGRPHFFDSPAALTDHQQAFEVLRSVRALPADSGADMALVVNYRDRFYSDSQLFLDETDARNPNNGRWWAIYRNTPLRFHRSGAVFDLMTLDDLLASKKVYRKIVFVTGYALSNAERATMKRLTRRRGVTSVWFVAPGSITDTGFSDAAMSDLVGMQLQGAGANPAVKCVDAAAKAISIAGGGWAARPVDGAFSLFFPDVPKTPEAAAEIVDFIGEHRYVKDDAYVRRHGDYLMVHVGKAGEYTLLLPAADQNRAMTELFTHRHYTQGPLVLKCDGPETWMFRLETR